MMSFEIYEKDTQKGQEGLTDRQLKKAAAIVLEDLVKERKLNQKTKNKKQKKLQQQQQVVSFIMIAASLC